MPHLMNVRRFGALALLLGAPLGSPLAAQGDPRPAPTPAPAVSPRPPRPAPAVAPVPAVAPAAAAAPAIKAEPALWGRLESLSATVAGAEAFTARAEAFSTSLTTARAELAARTDEFNVRMSTATITREGGYALAGLASSPRPAWAQGDPADSLYRAAREQLNRGDYRGAVASFKDIQQKHPNSTYAAEAPYWQAFALYRIGGTSDLQEALQVLETQRTKFPGARTQADAAALGTRIAGVLSGRGQGNNDLVKRALAAADGSTLRCDREDLSVRSEALNALMQTAPEAALPMARKILDRRDECSTELRRSALYLVANKRDATSVPLVVQVARNEPDADVRSDAIAWLGRLPGDEPLTVLEEIAGKADDERAQRAAVRALAAHANPRARTAMRTLAEKAETPERLRLAVIDAFDNDRTSLDDATWLRTLYGRTDNARLKGRIINALARAGGESNMQFLASVVRNEGEAADVRASALRSVGRTMDLASLAKFYDSVAQRALREQLIDLLGNRTENEATDKLIEIVRGGTDPQLRRQAISALTRKKDPRTTKLLMEILDK